MRYLNWLKALLVPGRRLVPGILAAALVAGLAGPAAARDGFSTEESPFGFGKQHFSFGTGVGQGFDFLSSRGHENSKVEQVAFMPSWSVGVTRRLAAGRWYSGNVDVVGEGMFLFNREPRSGAFYGGTVSLRYNLLEYGRVTPFVSVGAGGGYLSYDLDDQSDGFNFMEQLGVGAHWRMSERLGLSFEYRYQHVSNANLRNPNGGINAHFFLLGATYYYGNEGW